MSVLARGNRSAARDLTTSHDFVTRYLFYERFLEGLYLGRINLLKEDGTFKGLVSR
jgi:hypothetical protein